MVASSRENFAMQGTARLSPLPTTRSRPFASPSSNAKSELQELLQKSEFNYPRPKYEHLSPTGPSHKRQFTCKCVVIDHRDQVIHETQGTGSTKKEAEVSSAAQMLPIMKAMLEDGGQLTPVRREGRGEAG